MQRQAKEDSPLISQNEDSMFKKIMNFLFEPTIAVCKSETGGSYNVSPCCVTTTVICTTLGVAGYPVGTLITHGAHAAKGACLTEVETVAGVVGFSAVVGCASSGCGEDCKTPRTDSTTTSSTPKSCFPFHYIPPAQHEMGAPHELEPESPRMAR